jgi:hypothetical protein
VGDLAGDLDTDENLFGELGRVAGAAGRDGSAWEEVGDGGADRDPADVVGTGKRRDAGSGAKPGADLVEDTELLDLRAAARPSRVSSFCRSRWNCPTETSTLTSIVVVASVAARSTMLDNGPDSTRSATSWRRHQSRTARMSVRSRQSR